MATAPEAAVPCVPRTGRTARPVHGQGVSGCAICIESGNPSRGVAGHATARNSHILHHRQYHGTEIVSERNGIKTYKGVRKSDSRPVLIKSCHSELKTGNNVHVLRHEFALRQHLDGQGAPLPLAVEQVGTTVFEILEDTKAESSSRKPSTKSGELQEKSWRRIGRGGRNGSDRRGTVPRPASHPRGAGVFSPRLWGVRQSEKWRGA